MNTFQGALIALAVLTAAGCASKPERRPASLTFDELRTTMGGDVRAQPVLSNGGVRGYRLYGIRTSPQLSTQGLSEGSLMTSVCGVSANDIFRKKGQIDCTVDPSPGVELRFALPGEERRVLISR